MILSFIKLTLVVLMLACLVRDSLSQPFSLSSSEKFSHPYLKVADSLLKARQYAKALSYYEIARNKFNTQKLEPGIIYSINMKSHCYLRLGNFDAMLKSLNAAYEIGRKSLGLAHPLVAITEFYLGEYFFYMNAPDTSMLYYEKALSTLQLQNNKAIYALELANVYNGVGSIYNYYQYKFDKAEENFKKALSIQTKLLEGNAFALANTYYNLAANSRAIGNFPAASGYGEKALNIFKTHKDSKRSMANCYQILGNAYFTLLNYSKAEENYKKSIEFLNDLYGAQDIILTNSYNNIGSLFNEKGEHSKAISYFSKSLRINSINKNQNVNEQTNSYFNLGLAYHFLKSYDSSIYYYRKCLSLRKLYFGDKHLQTSDCLQYIAELFEDYNQFDSALYYYQEALIAGVQDFNAKDISRNPVKEQIGLNHHVLSTLERKCNVLNKKYLTNGNTDLLRLSLASISLADSSIIIYKNHFSREGTKLIHSSLFKTTYENGIETAYLLYKATNNKEYVITALKFMEQTKAIYLRESIERSEKYKTFGIPESILAEGAELLRKLGELKQAHINLKSDGRNQAKADSILSETFETTKLLDEWHEHLSKKYSELFKIDYHQDYIERIQQTMTSKTHEVIEFFSGDDAIFAISILTDDVDFIMIEKNPALVSAIENYRSALRSDIIANLSDSSFQEFVLNANLLYERLVSPFLKRVKNITQLTFIPDGELAYIPFEAFLTNSNPRSKSSYKNLPYLINGYSISYQYSLGLMTTFSKKRRANKENKVLAFSFSKDEFMNDKKEDFMNLPGTRSELQAVSSIMPGTYLFDDDATETHFKEHGSEYQILHFALHGEASDSSQGARLIFNTKETGRDDGSLYADEVYSMKLNTELVVLSACETGVGIMHNGEGIYSIARAFVYAGSPSVIMTLWQINDQSTAQLISRFYQSMINEISIDESLRKAKLDFIVNSTEHGAHPSNWASVIALGKMEPLQQKSDGVIYQLIVVALFLLIIAIRLFKKKELSSS